MIKPSQCLIIGGGNSINEGIALGLKEQLENRFVIACNYAFLHFPHTLLCFVDKDFYFPSAGALNAKTHPDIREQLKKEELIIGFNASGVAEHKLDNTILLKGHGDYHSKESLIKGIYTPILVGLFALTLAQILLDWNGEIFLLGYDWTRRKKVDEIAKTHYYSNTEIAHRGHGFTKMYENHNPNHYFKVYKESKIKIYNVSPQSNIENFEKITYEQMLNLLHKEFYNQNELRQCIKEKLCIK